MVLAIMGAVGRVCSSRSTRRAKALEPCIGAGGVGDEIGQQALEKLPLLHQHAQQIVRFGMAQGSAQMAAGETLLAAPMPQIRLQNRDRDLLPRIEAGQAGQDIGGLQRPIGRTLLHDLLAQADEPFLHLELRRPAGRLCCIVLLETRIGLHVAARGLVQPDPDEQEAMMLGRPVPAGEREARNDRAGREPCAAPAARTP